MRKLRLTAHELGNLALEKGILSSTSFQFFSPATVRVYVLTSKLGNVQITHPTLLSHKILPSSHRKRTVYYSVTCSILSLTFCLPYVSTTEHSSFVLSTPVPKYCLSRYFSQLCHFFFFSLTSDVRRHELSSSIPKAPEFLYYSAEQGRTSCHCSIPPCSQHGDNESNLNRNGAHFPRTLL